MKKKSRGVDPFEDKNGRRWSTQLGDLKVGSKFILYGRELCTIKTVQEGVGPGGVTYLWKGKEYHGLPPIRVDGAWCEEKG